ncbi:transposase [Methylococcaceae bacterium HT4]|nr:hypothetical protein [Methyloprofundus sp.]TXK94544.1 transposase [Methylococcaceae bacterium CS4]TXL01301.1 transposase [Methylococcaceae bacterium CS5]TXL08925.1 transposase [Methylococcaceae bacterium CS1]TXL09242.1 transposase [Methylococcaceae bacterium CS3]TXL11889.1 transposase [Methylococcaceae bacterium CS2]TXL16144.1 transposase [Methylococcaceae bacterium HT4]
MIRPLRIKFSGALCHVTSIGGGREDIYLDEEDRELYLTSLIGRYYLLHYSTVSRVIHSGMQK